MNDTEFQLRGVEDARLAIHATSALPVWLWSTDGARVLWANPVGVMVLGAPNITALTARTFGPADPQRRQIAQLAMRLLPNAGPRLERLRGFGASLGGLATCACTRLVFTEGEEGILIASAASAGRSIPLAERLQRLVEDAATPVAAFGRDGLFVSASAPARPLLGFRNLSEAGLDGARHDALRDGRVETPIGIGHMVLQRVGSGADTALIALIAPGSCRFETHSTAAASALHDATPEPAASATPVEQTNSIPVDPVATPIVSTASPANDDAAPSPGAPEPIVDDLLFDAFDDTALAQPGTVSEGQPHETASSARPSTGEPSEERDNADAIAAAVDETPSMSNAGEPDIAPPLPDPVDAPAPAESSPPLRQPLRFMWQMDAEGRFALGSDEFTRLIGAQTAAAFGRLWHEIVEVFDLDPQGLVAKAVATQETWSGITLQWPVDDSDRRLPVELSGLPVFDRTRTFIGYRGFGVCRDIETLVELAHQRHQHLFEQITAPRPLAADTPHRAAAPADFADATTTPRTEQAAAAQPTSLLPTEPDHLLENSQNVVPFPSTGDTRSPALTPVESSAFNELARQLSARLEHDNAGSA